jgi:hypothetical protein
MHKYLEESLDTVVKTWGLNEDETFWLHNLVHYYIYRMRCKQMSIKVPDAMAESIKNTEDYWGQFREQ